MLCVRPRQIRIILQHSQWEANFVGGLKLNLMQGTVFGPHHHIGAPVSNLRLFRRKVLNHSGAEEQSTLDSVAFAEKQCF